MIGIFESITANRVRGILSPRGQAGRCPWGLKTSDDDA
jgi:hypothetical protein